MDENQLRKNFWALQNYQNSDATVSWKDNWELGVSRRLSVDADISGFCGTIQE